MWIKKADLGIDNIFTDDVVYTESWSPKYENRKTVKHGCTNGIHAEIFLSGRLSIFSSRQSNNRGVVF